jgi:hypothetical protein
MNVEIGTEAAYLFRIFSIVSLQCRNPGGIWVTRGQDV